ncbi:MAG: peroxiredoxin [Candidatus Ranarchaeia archaeon]
MSKITPEPGDTAPDFCLPNSEEVKQCLKAYRGRWVVLYFYPRDNTPGCSIEAMSFTRLKKEFADKNTIIFGVSKDSCQSHRNFIAKKQLTITLLSDPDKIVHQKYGVCRMKKFMGREFMGTVRTTFLIDPDGKIVRRWNKVKAKGHAQDVLDTVKQLSS